MNTTFTNYAEKKAKQFLNLLQGYTKGIRITAILILLLMGVSNAWGGNGFYEVYMVYSSANSDHNYTFTSGQNNIGTYDLSTGTSPFVIKELYLKFWDDWKDKPTVGGQMCYKINDGATQYFGNNTWSQTDYSGNNSELQNSNCNHTVVSASGKYTFKIWWQMWGWGSDSWINNGGKNYTWTYTILPPAVSNIGISATGCIGGTGTQQDPYTVAYGESLTLTASVNNSDANSNTHFTFGSNAASTTKTHTITNITNATAQKITIKAQNINKSDNSLKGTELSKDIYYKYSPIYLYINGENHLIDNTTKQVTVPLNKNDDNQTYTFKIHDNSNHWLGNNGTMERGGDAVHSGGWTMSADAGDCKLKADLTGDYTFTFIPATNKVTVTYPQKSYFIAGSWDNWAGTAPSFVDASTPVSIYLEADQTYSFKVADLTATAKWYGNDGTMTRANSTAWAMSTDKGNCHITTDLAGIYDFTFNQSTKKLTVTYPTAYTLTYGSGAGGSGTVTANNSIKSGDLVLAGTSVTLTATPASGYDFAAWYSDEACEGAVVSSNNPYNFSINSNTTLYAKWKALSFELTWDPNGGTITTPGSPEGGKVEAGTPLTPPTVTKDHYDHTGWTPEEPTVMPGEDVTYIAQWTPTEYTITYHLNGGIGTMTPTTYTIESETFALPNNPTKTGSTFAGWYDNSEFNGEAITTIASGSTGDKEFWAKWDIGTYDVTLDMEGGNGGTASVNVAYGAAMPTITIPTKNDHLFDGYYDGDNGTGIKYYNADGTSAKNWDKETATLYAKWIPYSQCIFFKNNLKWNNVYVYTFNNEIWHNDKGVQPTVNRIEYGKMTQVGETDIYYYILTNLTGFSRIAFSEKDMHDYEFFYESKAIYRGDRSDQMPLFIPQTDQTATTTNKTEYYSSGIWMKYNSTESGYDWRGATDENNQEQWSKKYDFTASKPGGYSFTATVEFDNTSTHYFKIHNTKGDWFGNGGTMTQDNCTDWTFGTNNTENAKITPTITGKYIFTVYLGDGEVKVSLDYPLSVGDYRLAYKDNTEGSHHPGHYLKKHSTSQTDTVSFFIHHHNQQPVIFVEQCTEITDGEPTWDKIDEITNNPAASITEPGVYNFYLQQIENEALPRLVNEAMPYTGNYYIRTDAADGGWDSFRQKSNQITYSSFADGQLNSNFNHYYCKYIEAGRNVKFTIANDYSYCISDTLDNDEIIEEGQSSVGCLPINANVRFGWDSKTNEISRAYIKGAGMTSDRFLVLQGNEHLKDANGNAIPKGTDDRTGLEANEEILVDQQNWIYQVDVTADNATLVKLIAEYNEQIQYFKGSDTESTGLLSSTATDEYKIRLIYDFKSNHLVTAWLAGGTVQGEKVLGADMMVIRKNQRQAEQLNFDPTNSKMNEVGTGYAVMTFTKAYLENLQADNETPLSEELKKTERERSLYWVSFPFDVKVSDVFGFGEYAEHWILQYYDGAERAEKGLFSDSGTYWKYIFDTDTELKAGQGYVLVLDLDKIEFLHGATEVSLYFPSTNPLTTISGVLPTEHDVPAHECTIDREFEDNGKTYNHKFTDSHWNLIGVPGFADITGFNVTENEFVATDPSFYYEFDLSRSKYNVTAGSTNFQAMYAYMVQFAGTIDWSLKSVDPVAPPAAIAARRYSDERPEKVVLRLELAQGEEVADRTFVQMQQEGATANFDLSLDLTKIVNIGVSNIYTLTDSLKIQVAGNALPMEETVVPVGVNIATAGEYTFRMPDGTEGMVVELIDYETNTRTNLLLSDYTVNLPAGSNETRFALSIKPEKTATNVGNIGGTMNDGQGVRKFIIDGKLYLQKDGMLYDAQGHIVR